jgi:hypothetical protein
MNCDLAQELGPDLALGTLAGDERAQLLDHIASCQSCADQVTDLGTVVDRLLLLAPSVDPPAGFETAVLRRIAPERRRRWPTRVLVGSIAALLIIGAVVVVEQHRQDSGLTYDVHSLAAIGGRQLRAAPLVSPSHKTWGQAFVYEGNPSWVFVEMQWDVPSGIYAIALDRQNGQPSMIVNGLRLTNGQGSMGHTVGDTTDITDIRVVDAQGHTMCEAQLTT